MLELLRDPAWQFVGAVLALLALIATVVIYRRQQQNPALAWQVLSTTPLLSVGNELRSRIKILLDDQPVDQVHLILLRLINMGTGAIRPTDFERPLCFAFGMTTIILNGEVTKASDPSLQATIALSVDELRVDPVLLNGGDWIEIKVLVTQYDGPIKVDGRIAGVKQIQRFDPRIVRAARFSRAFNIVQALIVIVAMSTLIPGYPKDVAWLLAMMEGLALVFLIIEDTNAGRIGIRRKGRSDSREKAK